MSGDVHNNGRARGARLHMLIAAGALPLLAACSSSSSVEYVADAFPSQSLVDLLKESKSSQPAAPSAMPPAQPAAADASPPAPASTPPPVREPPPVSATAAANPPPATPSAANDDPVASAFPSVSLIDLVTGRKPGAQ